MEGEQKAPAQGAKAQRKRGVDIENEADSPVTCLYNKLCETAQAQGFVVLAGTRTIREDAAIFGGSYADITVRVELT
ncbi:MAG TPA: hypothetical protein VGL38_12390 [bacterium]|jgi:L-asparaginase/Glu-tRNA(Gln) amidotransferase subunit D